MKESVTKLKKYYRPLIGSALMSASMMQLALPVIAGTAAGTTISNTATGTYKDDNNNTYDTKSNTVQVVVAEVAGITVKAQPADDVNSGSVIKGDTIVFPFTLTNVGNDTSKVFVPGSDVVKNYSGTKGLDPTTVFVVVDANNNGKVDFTDTNGNGVPDPGEIGGGDVIVPAAGGTIGELGGTTALPRDQSTTVFVIGKVADGVNPGDLVQAQLGNTGSNNSANPDSQNIADRDGVGGSNPGDTAGGETNDVRTIDVNPGNGAPVNGEREAADTTKPLTVGQKAAEPLALATILKTAQTIDPKIANNSQDDEITYGLTLRVENTSPNVNFSAADLVGTPITLNNAQATRILVSDVIPVTTGGTQMSFKAGSAIAPAGWKVVYSADDPNTTVPIVVAGSSKPAAKWFDDIAQLNGQPVKRIGFVLDQSDVVTKGSTVTGFKFTTITTGLPQTGGPIYNIAQVLGQTDGGSDNGTPNDLTDDPIVYDESGDQNPVNFSDNGTPIDPTFGSKFDSVNNTGVPNPTKDGLDNKNDNTGKDEDPTKGGGEDNVVNIGTQNLVNGPENQASAIGPNNNNDDFQNKSTPVTLNDLSDGDIDTPTEVVFKNTFRNNSSSPLDNVTLRPIGAGDANQAPGNNINPNPFVTDALPNGTVVTITYNGKAVTYTYNSTTDKFVLDANQTPIDIDAVPVGTDITYEVKVKLPADTPQLKGYAVPIVAFVNNDNDESFNPTGNDGAIYNITIDRVYTGYLQLIKKVRILDAQDAVRTTGENGADADGFIAGNPTTKIQPGWKLEYKIEYRNISTAQPVNGSGNTILNAKDVVVSDNGLGAQGFALDQDGNGAIDTSHVTGKATVTTAGATIEYYNGNPAVLGTEKSGTNVIDDVTEYRSKIPNVAPQANGSFSFQRKLN
jgi:hypothetical protein